MRLRHLFEAPTKRAAFALGRLNPATTGHELLVNAIKQAPGDSFLFLTDRAPKLPDNPLTAEEKLDWARKSFDGISIGLAKTVLTAADRLYKMGYTDVTFLEGEPKLYKILTQYNGVEKEMHNYNFSNIDYVQLQRNAAAADATGMSASKLRQTVIDNNFEAFKKGVTQSAQPHAEQMFKKLQGIMGVDSAEEGMIIYVGDQKFEYYDYTLEDAMRIVDEYADEMDGEPYEVYNADGKLVASGTMRSGAFHEPGIKEGHSPHKKGTKKYKKHMAAMHANM